MFNVFKFDDSKSREEDLLKQQAKRQRQKECSQTLKVHLADRYKQRIAQKVAMMSLKPISTSTPTSKPFLGDTCFRHKPRNSLDRVQDNVQINKWLDTVPNPKPTFKLRERSPGKELQPHMRFQHRNQFDRIRETWYQQKDILEPTWSISPKSPIPVSGNKLYYKTIETIANEVSDHDPETVNTAKNVWATQITPKLL